MKSVGSNIIRKFSFKSPFSRGDETSLPKKDDTQNPESVMLEEKNVEAPSPVVDSQIVRKDSKTRRPQKKLSQITTICNVCQRDFKSPKVIPCQHIFCESCLTDFVSPSDVLCCPTCHSEYLLRNGDVSILNDGTSLVSEIKLKRSNTISRKTSTTSCSACQKYEAGLCQHCRKLFCFRCLPAHAETLEVQLEKIKDFITKQQNDLNREILKTKDVCKDQDINLSEVERVKIEAIQRLVENARHELALHERNRLQTLDKMSKGLDKALKSTEFRRDNQSPEEFIDHLINMQADLVATVSQLDDAYLHNLTFNDEKLKFVKTKRKQSMALSSAASELAKLVNSVDAVPDFASFKKTRLSSVQLSGSPSCAAISTLTNDIFICIPKNKQVVVLNKSGQLKSVIEEDFDTPIKVAFSSSREEIYILDKGKNSIAVLSIHNELVDHISQPGSNVGELSSPSGFSFHPETGNFLIADTGNNRVQMIDRDGHFQKLFGGRVHKSKSGRSAIFESDLLQPDDVCSNQRFVIVSDSGNNLIRIYSFEAEYLKEFKISDSWNGSPSTSICTFRTNYLIVSDPHSNKIQVYDLTMLKLSWTFTSLKSITCVRPHQTSETENLIMCSHSPNSVFLYRGN